MYSYGVYDVEGKVVHMSQGTCGGLRQFWGISPPLLGIRLAFQQQVLSHHTNHTSFVVCPSHMLLY